jgi:hypothetical protein
MPTVGTSWFALYCWETLRFSEAGFMVVVELMDSSQGLKYIQELLKPRRLNSAQEIVFLGSWDAKRYQEIAQESGYDFDYLKEVGAQLWLILSQTLGRSVSKKNVRLVVSEIALGSPSGAFSAQARIEAATGLDLWQFPSEAIPLNSVMYVDRPPIEQLACQEILKLGGFVRIRAPKKMGKTSLVLRMLEIARRQGMRTAVLDFQTVDQEIYGDLERFLKWVCANISRQVGLSNEIERYWDADSGSKMSCHVYFQEHILKAANTPIFLVLDELNRIFEFPTLAQDFLPLLRSWHDEAARNPIWQNFRLTVAHSTEIYTPLNINQSPFNVGLPIELPTFTIEQVQALAKRHQLNLPAEEIQQVFELLEGHPYLTQLLFYELRQAKQSFAQLIAEAPTPNGIYNNHLKENLLLLQRDPQLQAALKSVLNSDQPLQIEAVLAYRLESLGLIRWVSDYAVTMRTMLYRKYFSAQL